MSPLPPSFQLQFYQDKSNETCLLGYSSPSFIYLNDKKNQAKPNQIEKQTNKTNTQTAAFTQSYLLNTKEILR